MTLRIALLALVATVALGIAPPAPAAARPADLDGWRAARWGMTGAELDRAFGDAPARLPGRREYGGAYATRYLDDVVLGARHFRAMFQMNATDDRLQQVLLEPRERPQPAAAFRQTRAALEAAYGPPDGRCATPRTAGGGPLSVDLWWRFATTTVHLTFLDFHTTSMIFEEGFDDRNPATTDNRIAGADPRQLPRRMLVRFHPTARADLMASDCPAPAR